MGKHSFMVATAVFASLLASSGKLSAQEAESRAQMTGHEIMKPALREIPLKAKFLQTEDPNTDCDQLPEEEFTDISFPHLPGFAKGAIWIEISFSINMEENGSFFNFTFQNESIPLAEIFVLDMGKWEFCGRAGRNILAKDMSDPNYALSIPFCESDYEAAPVRRARIRIIQPCGQPINVKLVPHRRYSHDTSLFLRQFQFAWGVALFISIALLFIGIAFRDLFYTSLSFTTLFFLMLQMQVRGHGSAYIWNSLSAMAGNSKIIHFLECAIFLSMILSAGFLLNGKLKKSAYFKTMPFLFEFIVIIFILNITLQSESVIFANFIITSVLGQIVFLTGIAIDMRRSDTTTKIIMGFWIPYFAYSIVSKIAALLRAFFISSVLDFLGKNNFILALASFLCLSLPPLYLLGKKFSNRFSEIKKSLEEFTREKESILKENGLYKKVFERISGDAKTVLNFSCAAAKNPLQGKVLGQIEMVKFHSARIADSAAAVSILEKKEAPAEMEVAMLDYFHSCMEVTRNISELRKISISSTTAIASDCIVLADPRILDVLFIEFMQSAISMSERKSRISILFENRENEFTLNISNKMDAEEFKAAKRLLQEKSTGGEFYFTSETAKIYGGEISAFEIDSGGRFCLRFSLQKIPEENSRNVITRKIIFEPAGRYLDKETEAPAQSTEEKKPESEAEPEKKAAPQLYPALECLSQREQEIAMEIARGKSDKEIAESLSISPATVATHNKKIFKKTGVHSRVELMNFLIESSKSGR